MENFKVEIVKDANNNPIGVRAAQVNGRDIVIALKDYEPCDWYTAVKIGIPSSVELEAIYENKDEVNTALIKAGGEPLKEDWYWCSSEGSSSDAWSQLFTNGGIGWYFKDNSPYVRPVLAL